MSMREVLVDWLTASRHVQWLEKEHNEQRAEYRARLDEKERFIHEQRVELAGLKLECDRMRQILMPLGSSAGMQYSQAFQPAVKRESKPVPEFDGPLDWTAELQKLCREDSQDGVRSE